MSDLIFWSLMTVLAVALLILAIWGIEELSARRNRHDSSEPHPNPTENNELAHA
jgi:hypothetical protein